ncbi:TetR family transcriptional regulator [Actinomadura rugatobispora]|uniref:TetR family transcriptional regulator n=1 Tax=Actinomadura rugatobispora TaxID=1994 RepID=A0ABW1A5D0_9ACTN|nr:TetR/AcrR family transcriptional regulator [Actinomadura rugatobispora]
MDATTPQRPRAARRPAATRREQADATRVLLLRTAERLYAEHGLAEVSNRQIVEAAGQGNNSALAYYFGSRADLIRAIARFHGEPIARRIQELAREARDSDDPRDHIASLALPYTEHLAELGHPTWYARFTAQVCADPTLGPEELAAPLQAPLFRKAIVAVRSQAPGLSPKVAALRSQSMRLVVIHTCAEQERAAAYTGRPADWTMVGEALVDMITGMLLASPQS